MGDRHLQNLIEKYLNGTANAFEKKQLDDWYRAANEKEVIWIADSPEEEYKVADRMLKKLQEQVSISKTTVVPFYKRSLPKAAAVLTGFLLLIGYYFFRSNHFPDTTKISVQAPLSFKENKYILLPDSSKVLLHPGSKMSYMFNGKIRDLVLSGEAYFDIKHQKEPFVIHTGFVVTTVLGTAFNIKAYPGQKVTVSVIRGKVSVINKMNSSLAILTPDQQVVSSEDTESFYQQPAKAQQLITWVKADMQFDDMPFKQLAERLARRYNVEVKFKNPELEKCLITGRFSGTESIEQVLQILSETMGTFYTINGITIILDGKGC